MALWEYKVITSGAHGFASPTLLEAHLNALGKDEWEIIHFQTLPTNPLAFTGLARRSTTRDWTPPEVAIVTAPRPSAYEPAPAAKPAASAAADEKPELPPALIEPDAPKSKVEDTSLRRVRDTERDLDPEALAEEDEDWDNWEKEQDELPTLFEAIKPHLRRNQKGPGMSVALDYLAKRWDQKEADIAGALIECGFTLPEAEESDPDYFEFEGDLYWVNRNNRGQLFLNTREKPRPTFRTAPVKKLAADDPASVELVAERAAEKAEIEKRRIEREERQAAVAAAAAAKAAAREERYAAAAASHDAKAGDAKPAEAPSGPTEPLPTDATLLDRIRPLMRRNRRGPGYSGSVSFLARALKTSEAELVTALSALGLNVQANPADKPENVEIAGGVYWINKDNRGGIWINGREQKEVRNGGKGSDESEAPAASELSAPSAPESSPDTNVDSPALGSPAPETASTPESSVVGEATAPVPPVSVETASTASDSPESPGASAAETSGEEPDESVQLDAKGGKPKRPARTRGPRKPKAPKE